MSHEQFDVVAVQLQHANGAAVDLICEVPTSGGHRRPLQQSFANLGVLGPEAPGVGRLVSLDGFLEFLGSIVTSANSFALLSITVAGAT